MINSSTFCDGGDIFDSNDKQFSIVELPTELGIVFVLPISTKFNERIIFLQGLIKEPRPILGRNRRSNSFHGIRLLDSILKN